jgi:flagellar protein FlaF
VNVIEQARQAYAPNRTAVQTGRSTEFTLFSQITARLRAASAPNKENFAELASAIHDNRRLWTILAADVSDVGNTLPDTLRAQIFYLSEFTQIHSRKVLRGAADVSALLDVNAAIMSGLANLEAPQ